jgi:predicted enzyme related to lactoylglutathione lyase
MVTKLIYIWIINLIHLKGAKSTMANYVVHFEIYVDDLERAKKFYTQVLEWAFKDEIEMNYTLVYPSGKVEEGSAKVGINGGMLLRPGKAPENNRAAPNAFVCTVAVDNIDSVLSKVIQNGGRIDMPVEMIPGVGKIAYVRDTEFNMIGLLQPSMK